MFFRLIKKLTEKELVTDKISEGDTKFMGVAKLPKHKHFRFALCFLFVNI